MSYNLPSNSFQTRRCKTPHSTLFNWGLIGGELSFPNVFMITFHFFFEQRFSFAATCPQTHFVAYGSLDLPILPPQSLQLHDCKLACSTTSSSYYVLLGRTKALPSWHVAEAGWESILRGHYVILRKETCVRSTHPQCGRQTSCDVGSLGLFLVRILQSYECDRNLALCPGRMQCRHNLIFLQLSFNLAIQTNFFLWSEPRTSLGQWLG